MHPSLGKEPFNGKLTPNNLRDLDSRKCMIEFGGTIEKKSNLLAVKHSVHHSDATKKTGRDINGQSGRNRCTRP